MKSGHGMQKKPKRTFFNHLAGKVGDVKTACYNGSIVKVRILQPVINRGVDFSGCYAEIIK